jgi:hypothetical protein
LRQSLTLTALFIANLDKKTRRPTMTVILVRDDVHD